MSGARAKNEEEIEYRDRQGVSPFHRGIATCEESSPSACKNKLTLEIL